MNNIFVLCLFLTYFGTINCCFQSRCRGGQEYNSCGSFCTPTCEDPTPSCIEVCWPRCECPSGQLWHERECITEDRCPPRCPKDQIWSDCGSDCEKTCLEPFPTCNERCVVRCECPPGEVFDELERCVPINECPNDCEGNLVLLDCEPGCQNNCDGSVICHDIIECIPGCYCPADGYLGEDGTCYTSAGECPLPDECEGNLVPLDCTPGCMNNCDGSVMCFGIVECRPGCYCPADGYHGDDGTCYTSLDECPPLAPCGPDARPLVDNTGDEIFCGRGPTRQDCPTGSMCNIHPADVYAVCCPDTVSLS